MLLEPKTTVPHVNPLESMRLKSRTYTIPSQVSRQHLFLRHFLLLPEEALNPDYRKEWGGWFLVLFSGLKVIGITVTITEILVTNYTIVLLGDNNS